MALFIGFILMVGYVFGQITDAGIAPVFIAGLFSFFMTGTSYFYGDAIALAASGAVRIEKQDHPYVYRMVENLCITAGLPMPKVHIIPDKAMNAFATGRDPKHASIALTTGIIETLKNEELEGVIAHELSHVQNYDIRLMTVIIVLIGLVTLLSDWMMRSLLFRRNDDRNNIHPVLVIVGVLLMILSPIIAQLIQLAVSRKREFLADASGALLTRYPEGLASALEKIAAQNRPLMTANSATAHLFFSNPFAKKTKFFSKLFQTHPPIEERIAALRNMNISS